MVPSGNRRRASLLLVEDNPADARLTEEALSRGLEEHELHIVEDGVEAMAFLRREGDYAEAAKPDLILLDLNLPKKSGHEVLTEVKADPELRRIPVVVLSSSEAKQDIEKSYDLQASSYICKPVDLDRFFEVIQDLQEYWLGTSQLPNGSGR